MVDTDIAVIGMSCRLPGCTNVDEFWHNLKNGKESISTLSEDEMRESGGVDELLNDPNYVKRNGAVGDIGQFDAEFFDISDTKAKAMDPQHRFFLEHCWQALESAGYNPLTYKGAIGLYAGCGLNQYFLKNLMMNKRALEQLGPYLLTLLNDKDFMVTRTAYKLNLTGPAVTIQTACSTSLVAVHHACQSLLNGDCNIALAGGVSLSVPQNQGYLYQAGMILSPDGHCRAFDAEANGTVGGSGVSIVVLKPLEEAIEDGDFIYAVIKGTAINNDGHTKVNFTAPSVEGQSQVIQDAIEDSGVNPREITYVEAHGTGTKLGDPIEIEALTQAYRAHTKDRGFCAIGSVKTNIGHTDTAAGCAGLIKVIQMLQHQQIPPSLHYTKPNPHIDFEQSPFYVNRKLTDWPGRNNSRKAAVSSFGIGGTNAHVILEQAPKLKQKRQIKRNWFLVILSARTKTTLAKVKTNLISYLRRVNDMTLEDVAYTLQIGRKAFCRRLAILVQGNSDLIKALSKYENEMTSDHFDSSQNSTNLDQLEQEVNLLLFRQHKRIASGDYGTLSRLLQEKLQQLNGLIKLGDNVHNDAEYVVLNILMKLWLHGAGIKWQWLYGKGDCHRVPLPTYPFEHQHYWIDAATQQEQNTSEPQATTILAKEKEIKDWFYCPLWKQSPPVTLINKQDDTAKSNQNKPVRYLIFSDSCVFSSHLEQVLKSSQFRVITVDIGDQFMAFNQNKYCICPTQAENYIELVKAIPIKDTESLKIFHCWCMSASETEKTGKIDSKRLEHIQNLGFYSLIFLTQALGKFTKCAVDMTVLSNNLQPITGSETLEPEKATLLGAIRTIPNEYPNIICRSIDLAWHKDDQTPYLIKQIVHESKLLSEDQVIAYRNRQRWVQTFKKITLASSNKSTHFRENGVYLITGGLGGIGLALVSYIVQKVPAKFILFNRSKFPARKDWKHFLSVQTEKNVISQKIKTLQQLEQQGAEILVLQGDIADYDAVNQMIESVHRKFGHINGVIHAAGMADENLIQFHTRKSLASVMAPKVIGTCILYNLLESHDLDFFINCSSLNSIMASPGQVAYCAANNFLDSFAKTKGNDRSPIVSINWDRWKEVGMAVDATSSLENKIKQFGNHVKQLLENQEPGITSAEGQEVFNRILEQRLPQVITSITNLNQRIVKFKKVSITILNVLSGNQSTGKIAKRSRPNLDTGFVAPRNHFEQDVGAIFEDILGISGVGIHDNFFKLGGDSLLAVMTVAQINKSFGSHLTPSALAEWMTVEKIVAEIEREKNLETDSRKKLPFCIVELNKGDEAINPLFLFHPVGGTVYFYRDLVEQLNENQPVYGLQSQQLDGKSPPLKTVEEMVERFIVSIKEIQPVGPYSIGGSSFGGTLAFEAAHQLTNAGEKINLLILIDTPGPGSMPLRKLNTKLEIVEYFAKGRKVDTILSKEFHNLDDSQLLHYIESWGLVPEEFDKDKFPLFFEAFRTNNDSMSIYKPKPIDLSALFFSATETIEGYMPIGLNKAWEPLLRKGLKVIRIPGNHMTMNESSSIKRVAQAIQKRLLTSGSINQN